MRLWAFLLLSLALVTAVSAADYPSGVRDFVYRMLPNGTAFSVANFSFNSTTAYAVLSGSEIYAILTPNPPSVNPRALNNTDELEEALFSYMLSEGFDPNATSAFSAVHVGVDAIEDDDDSGTAECRRLLGTDRFECEDFESCRLACFATPFCPNFAYGGEPGEFIYVIWGFENDTRALDAAYWHEEKAYANFLANKSKENAEGYLAALSGLNQAATRVSGNSLFYYSFCPTPNYALSDMTGLQARAQRLYKNESRFFNLTGLAARVRNLTLDGLARRAPDLSKVLPEFNASGWAEAESRPANGTAYVSGAASGSPERGAGAQLGGTGQNQAQGGAVPVPKRRFALSAGFLAPALLIVSVAAVAVYAAYLVARRRGAKRAHQKTK